MPEHVLTPSQENYIQWIHRLAAGGSVQTGQLADRLGVRLPSVSRAVKGLAALGLVDHEAYGTIELTEKGREVALALARREECLNRLLVEILGLAPEDAGPVLDRIEHTVDPDLLVRLEALADFALMSEAWIKRLHLRIDSSLEAHSDIADVAVGRSKQHSGGREGKVSAR